MVYRFTGGTHRLIYLCKKEKKCISQNVLLFLEKTWIPNWGKWPTAAPPQAKHLRISVRCAMAPSMRVDHGLVE